MSDTINKLFSEHPFSFDSKKKNDLVLNELIRLTLYHYDNCQLYSSFINGFKLNVNSITKLDDIPFLPTRLFKEYLLSSVPNEAIFKIMNSSGTSGQNVSKIVLDKHTASIQTKTLTKLVSNFIGNERLPMMVIDHEGTIKDRKQFSARTAAIQGFSIFSNSRVFALNHDYKLNINIIEEFLALNSNKKKIIFGFTFLVWEYLYKYSKQLNYKPDLSNTILIHGGGWKNLQSESISKLEYNKILKDYFGLLSVHDYYGMIEQTGSIAIECEYGNLHASNYSDIIIRRPEDLSMAEFGEQGIIQSLSLLPISYPGHSLLTEDLGILLGEDGCPCQRYGKYFQVIGRITNAEIRGCSDTHVQR
jgi:phenylacetate-coenzyme A ligase PaaK-like adenylate-forming protein